MKLMAKHRDSERLVVNIYGQNDYKLYHAHDLKFIFAVSC